MRWLLVAALVACKSEKPAPPPTPFAIDARSIDAAVVIDAVAIDTVIAIDAAPIDATVIAIDAAAKPVVTKKPCYVGGCASEVCSDEQGIVSPCVHRPEHKCFKKARCERQANDQCDWTKTKEFDACLSDLARNGSME